MAGFGIQKDGLDSVIVKMDRAPAVYNAGDIFAGKVIVVCLETTPVKGIKVSQKMTNTRNFVHVLHLKHSLD